MVVYLFAAPFDKEFGYHIIKNNCYDHAAWMYNRMKSDVGMDVVFIGSSRTIHAIPDSLMEKHIQVQDEKDAHIVNFGYCRFGRNFDFEVVKDLLESKRISILVLEIREDEDQYSHPDFPYIADAHDVLNPVFFNQKYFNDIITALKVRIEFQKSRLSIRPQSAYTSSMKQTLFGYGSSDKILDADQLSAIAPDEEADTSSLLREVKMNFPKYFITKIVSIAKEHHVEIYFLYLPGYSRIPSVPKELVFYNKLGTVLIPPSEIFSTASNFIDENHLNDSGSGKLAVWLLQQPLFLD